MKRFDKKISARVSSHLLRALEEIAIDLEESKSSIIKRSILHYLDHHQKVHVPILRQRNHGAERYEED